MSEMVEQEAHAKLGSDRILIAVMYNCFSSRIGFSTGVKTDHLSFCHPVDTLIDTLCAVRL